jgi:hypothetical protein
VRCPQYKQPEEIMHTIVEYKLKEGETMGDAIWTSGVWRKKNSILTEYDPAYLKNGRCVNCLGRLAGAGAGASVNHQPWCPGNSMRFIVNFIYNVCVSCEKEQVSEGEKICWFCEGEVDECSCYTPEFCQDKDKHDEAYYAKKREEWKAFKASLGLKTD